jgi:hypothetical protein
MLQEGVISVILREKFGSVYVFLRFPGIIGVTVPLPFEKVLQLPLRSEEAVIDDSFHFVFGFSLY